MHSSFGSRFIFNCFFLPICFLLSVVKIKLQLYFPFSMPLLRKVVHVILRGCVKIKSQVLNDRSFLLHARNHINQTLNKTKLTKPHCWLQEEFAFNNAWNRSVIEIILILKISTEMQPRRTISIKHIKKQFPTECSFMFPCDHYPPLPVPTFKHNLPILGAAVVDGSAGAVLLNAGRGSFICRGARLAVAL